MNALEKNITDAIKTVEEAFPSIIYQPFKEALNVVVLTAKASLLKDTLIDSDAPAKRELPVKTTWKIKPEYEAIFADLGYDEYIAECQDHLPGNIKNVEKYYDKTTLIDFSAIPMWSIIELKRGTDATILAYFIGSNRGGLSYTSVKYKDYVKTPFNAQDLIRVVEWGNE